MRLAVTLAAVLITVSPAGAQQAAPAGTLHFASAAIEPSDNLQTISFGDLVPFIREFRVGPGDRFEANTTLRRLIDYANGRDDYWDRARGADPLLDQFFHVSAEGIAGSFAAAAPDGLPAVRYMLQQLLADRFAVAVTFTDETRNAMVLRRASPARLGPKLLRVPGGCAEGSQADADAVGLARCVWGEQGSKFKVVVKDFDHVAAWISKRGRLDVVNETGLIGAFAFDTAFDPFTINSASQQPHYPFEPSFAAAMKNDLDLVISYEPRRARALTVTHVEPLRED